MKQATAKLIYSIPLIGQLTGILMSVARGQQTREAVHNLHGAVNSFRTYLDGLRSAIGGLRATDRRHEEVLRELTARIERLEKLLAEDQR